MKILIIEDDIVNLNMLTEYLTFKGHQIETARNGRQGWNKLSQTPHFFDLVFLDIELPIMNGLEVLERTQIHGLTTPFVVMSGHIQLGSIAAEMNNVTTFLRKPFSLKEVERAINKLEPVY